MEPHGQSFTNGKLGRICGRRSGRDRKWIGRKRKHLGFCCEAKRGNEGYMGKIQGTWGPYFVEISLAKLWMMDQKGIQILQTTIINLEVKSTSIKESVSLDGKRRLHRNGHGRLRRMDSVSAS